MGTLAESGDGGLVQLLWQAGTQLNELWRMQGEES